MKWEAKKGNEHSVSSWGRKGGRVEIQADRDWYERIEREAGVKIRAVKRLLSWTLPGPNGCRLWWGPRYPTGYGRVKHAGRWGYAHRLMYALTRTNFNPGLCVCHSCDRPSCLNPAHLWQGTQADNNHDRASKGRNRKSGRGLPPFVIPSGRKFVAQARVNGKTHYFGTFNTAEEASRVVPEFRAQFPPNYGD